MAAVIPLAILFAAAAFSQTVTSSASASAGLAPGSLATIYGDHLAPVEEAIHTTPWPITLGDVQVTVTDSAMQTRAAGLLYVAPSQVNFEVPEATATGPATITILRGESRIALHTNIRTVAPALFTVGGSGIASASAVRVVMPSLDKTPVPVYRCSGRLPATCTLAPLAHQIDSVIYLSLYGTGIRNRSSLANVEINIDGTQVSPVYAGPDDFHPGRDRIDFPLPASLHGELTLTVTADGVKSNPVHISVQ